MADVLTQEPASDTTAMMEPVSPKAWRARIARCKRVRDDDLLPFWADNVDYRRGKPFRQGSDEDRVNVNLDWSLTKSKHAQLFSQMPQVYLTAKREEFDPAISPFGKQLNTTLTDANTGAAVNECVLDTINASGFGVVLVGYRATTKDKEVPKIDPSTLPPEQQAAVMAGTLQLETETVPTVVDRQFYVSRLSPSDFLWPVEFTGSCFDDADWLGHSGRMYWSEAQREFDLEDSDKDQLLTGASRKENLRDDQNEESQEPVVEYDEIFYWRYRFDSDETYFKRIYRIVFVHGLDDPVVDEPWKGQQFLEDGGYYVGACKFPLRVLTLTYISDDAIPPSDTAVGRPQVLELIRSRTQVIQNRDRSMPVRWYNTDRVDPMVQDLLNRGVYQGFIPLQGRGEGAIGEVARANYPREEFEFDRVIKEDLNEQWQVGSNQRGQFNGGRRSAAEAAIVDRTFQARIGFERSRIAEFIAGIAEVTAGLISLYSDFPALSDADVQRMNATWDRRTISSEFLYYLRPDSTILLDAEQRIDRLMKLLNLVGKSGYVDPKPLITEIVALHGVDPATVVHDPQPPRPDQPNISFRFDADALLNPVAVAMLLQTGQGPSPQALQAAINIIQEAVAKIPPGSGPVAPGQPAAVAGQPGAPPNPTDEANARPGWTPPERVTKRVDEPGG